MEIQYCSKCDQNKPLTDFARNRSRKTGRDSTCKVCKTQYVKEYYRKNTGAVKQYQKTRYEENKRKLAEYETMKGKPIAV